MVAAGKYSEPVTYRQSLQMPYLQAVLKEALRIHPATGLPLGRQVPEGGASICGSFFPAGTVVGVNSWVAHANKGVFGSDADQFRPERWLVEKQEYAVLDQYFLSVSCCLILKIIQTVFGVADTPLLTSLAWDPVPASARIFR